VAEIHVPAPKARRLGFAGCGKGARLRYIFRFRYPYDMRKRNKNICRGIGAKVLKRKFIKPLVHLIERSAQRQKTLTERALTKIQDVEDLVEIIARDIKRKSDSQS
jgi:hypothetical protein